MEGFENINYSGGQLITPDYYVKNHLNCDCDKDKVDVNSQHFVTVMFKKMILAKKNGSGDYEKCKWIFDRIYSIYAYRTVVKLANSGNESQRNAILAGIDNQPNFWEVLNTVAREKCYEYVLSRCRFENFNIINTMISFIARAAFEISRTGKYSNVEHKTQEFKNNDDFFEPMRNKLRGIGIEFQGIDEKVKSLDRFLFKNNFKFSEAIKKLFNVAGKKGGTYTEEQLRWIFSSIYFSVKGLVKVKDFGQEVFIDPNTQEDWNNENEDQEFEQANEDEANGILLSNNEEKTRQRYKDVIKTYLNPVHVEVPKSLTGGKKSNHDDITIEKLQSWGNQLSSYNDIEPLIYNIFKTQVSRIQKEIRESLGIDKKYNGGIK